MALILLIDRQNTHWNPEIQLQACYARWDIVEVYDDARHNGNLVLNPVVAPWVLIRVTETTRDQVMRLLDSPVDANGQVLRRRLYRIDVDAMPPPFSNQIAATRYVEISRGQIRNFIRNKITNAIEPDAIPE